MQLTSLQVIIHIYIYIYTNVGTDDLCLTMDQSERSYQLLGGYAAGQHLYRVSNDDVVGNNVYLVFCPEIFHNTGEQLRVKIPILQATDDHLVQLGNN